MLMPSKASEFLGSDKGIATMVFANRWIAGEALGDKLLNQLFIQQTAGVDILVLSIPRGGVVVGAAVAKILQCTHDVVVAKKIGMPGHPEAAVGAIAEDGPAILSPDMPIWYLDPGGPLDFSAAQTRAKIAAYSKKFHAGRTLDVRAKTVILVDDGIATGETMKAALLWLKSKSEAERPQHILIAVPVGSPKAIADLTSLADQVICLSTPRRFWAVSQFYLDFRQISDEEVRQYLPGKHLPGKRLNLN